jgi:NTP pyrophosphatase (non-canonical NTP hydrolase)
MTTLDQLQMNVERMYQERGYTADLMTLVLGLCEEAGEVAGAVNNLNPKYKQKTGRTQDGLAHELKDILVYVCAIANSAGVFLEDILPSHLKGDA